MPKPFELEKSPEPALSGPDGWTTAKPSTWRGWALKCRSGLPPAPFGPPIVAKKVLETSKLQQVRVF